MMHLDVLQIRGNAECTIRRGVWAGEVEGRTSGKRRHHSADAAGAPRRRNMQPATIAIPTPSCPDRTVPWPTPPWA